MLIIALLPLTADGDQNSTRMFQHAPYASGACIQCHTDPKARKGKLKEELPALCFRCHEHTAHTQSFVHGPVAAGACTSCHNPHESPNPKLLTFPNINAMCTSCHFDKAELLTLSNVHPPVAKQCTLCHDPHSEANRFQLKADRKKNLCIGCHTEKKEWLEKVRVKHGAVDRQEQCLGCHDPHATSRPMLLKEENSQKLCLKCHNAEVRSIEDAKMMINMGQHLRDNPDWHGPILWGDCAACHNPHGSDNFRLLKKPFPETSISQFDENEYICFECHEPEKMKVPVTETATNFRNGKKNIHYVHVNSVGITCRTCHDFHATKEYPHHLRKISTFGKTQFPLRYIESADGGSCDPICHARRSYDRKVP